MIILTSGIDCALTEIGIVVRMQIVTSITIMIEIIMLNLVRDNIMNSS